MGADTAVRPGQIYESCQPTFVVDGEETHTRLRVVGEPISTGGLYRYGKVQVATLTPEGREIRQRAIEVSQLHASGTTKTGAPRRTGYRLVQDAAS